MRVNLFERSSCSGALDNAFCDRRSGGAFVLRDATLGSVFPERVEATCW